MDTLKIKKVDISKNAKLFTQVESIYEERTVKTQNQNEQEHLTEQLELFKPATELKHSENIDSSVKLGKTDYFVLYELKEGEVNFQFMGIQLQKLTDHIKENTTNKLEINTTTEVDCEPKSIYSFEINPHNFQYLMSSSLSKPLSVYIFVKNNCGEQQTTTISEKITGYSLSFGLLLMINFMEHQFLQMLNMKDMLDLFFNDNLEEADDLKTWVEHLSFFDCNKQAQLVEFRDSFDSNLQIKSVFMDTTGN